MSSANQRTRITCRAQKIVGSATSLVISVSAAFAQHNSERVVSDIESINSAQMNAREDKTIDVHVDTIWQLALEFVSQGDLINAARSFRQIVRLEKLRAIGGESSNLARALIALGDCYSQLDCNELAEDSFLNAIVAVRNDRTDTAYASAWFGLAKLADGANRTDEALTFYRRALAVKATLRSCLEQDIRLRYAALLKRLGRDHDAAKVLSHIRIKRGGKL